MRSSDLYALLDRPRGPGDLKAAVAAGIPDFTRGLAERGRSAPVCVQSEGLDLLLTEAHVAELCRRFLSGHISAVETEYIATALELCPDFRAESESVSEAILLLADPVANGPLTQESVSAVLHSVRARGLTSGCS